MKSGRSPDSFTGGPCSREGTGQTRRAAHEPITQLASFVAVLFYRHRTQSFAVVDVDAYYYDKRNWKKEYDFAMAYGAKPYNPVNLKSVYGEMRMDPGVRKDFMDYYEVNSQDRKLITEKNWNAYWGGVSGLTDAEFNACFP